jgi:gas vesicle protein
MVVRSQKAKTMDITSTLPAALPRGMSVEKFKAVEAAEQKKAAIAKAATDRLSAPKNDGAEQTKARVREEIKEIRKRLNILKSLYANNPKEMAKALAQVFKELKAAIKEYKAALKSEMDNAGDAGVTALPAEPMPAADGGTAEKPEGDEAVKADAPEAGKDAAPESADPTAPYGAVETAAKTMVGEDGLNFTKEIRALVNLIEQKLLTPARIQKQMMKPDKATDEAFRQVEEQLKSLRKEIQDTDRDLKAEAPMAGMHLDIAA